MERLAEQPLDYEKRAKNDAETWLAETLEGSMRTPFEFVFDGQELYADDGGACRLVFEGALKDARTIADKSPNLLFELRRRQKEMDEYRDMLAMARGELPNTMVVVSDFPPELMGTTEDVGGYNVSRKQTMLRVLTWHDGKMTMVSQSLDLSDRSALEAIYHHLGVDCEPGELLGQRIHVDASLERQEFLVDELTGVYDRSLRQQKGGTWYAGQRDVCRPRNTYEFVCQQTDLTAILTDEFLEGSYSSEVAYSIAATIRKRFIGCAEIRMPRNSSANIQAVQQRLQEEIMLATAEAKAKGVIFSGCGTSVGVSLGAEDQLSANGYGNKINTETKYSFNKKMHCVVCQAPPKEGESKKMCGPCGICKSCDTKLSTD